MLRVLLIIAIIAVGIPAYIYLFWLVHLTLDKVCVRHARRYCKRNGLEVCRARWQPAFEPSGDRSVKTEFTLVQLDCAGRHKQRRLILLLVWPFCVRKLVSDELYPEFYDSQWPQTCP
jgi:hypothetical protein